MDLGFKNKLDRKTDYNIYEVDELREEFYEYFQRYFELFGYLKK